MADSPNKKANIEGMFCTTFIGCKAEKLWNTKVFKIFGVGYQGGTINLKIFLKVVSSGGGFSLSFLVNRILLIIMKKFLLVASVFATSFAFANSGDDKGKVLASEEVKTENQLKEEEKQLSLDELLKPEALYCKVTRKDGSTVECILCNCSKLEAAEIQVAEE